ncbi:MAG: hypothetical protein Q9225_007726 [Loekoesia sp. 1 TL-2023]
MPPREEGIGYGHLASKLALDNDLRIFRHFAELNIRNILYLQSELQELELKLQQLDAEANGNTNEPSKWSKPRSYHYASRTKGTALDGDDAYWNTVLRIRDVLERYSMFFLSQIANEADSVRYENLPRWSRADIALKLDKALRDEAWLQTLKTPSKISWSTVHEFISANKTLISEADAKYTADENLDDLVQLTWNEKEVLGVLMEKHLKRFFKKKVRATSLD